MDSPMSPGADAGLVVLIALLVSRVMLVTR
jgi:hypothetical protein